MNEVKRYYIGKYGLVEGEALGHLSVVLAAEHDAALASANSDKEAYGQNAIDLRKRVDALQQRLTVADELADTWHSRCVERTTERDFLRKRVGVLEGLLRKAQGWIPKKGYRRAHDEYYEIEAALNPARGGGDDS